MNLLGFEPWEALRAATACGGEAFGGEPMGQVKPGYLAELILIDGDPLADFRVFRGPDNPKMIMKGGRFHKRPAAVTEDRSACPLPRQSHLLRNRAYR